MSSDRKVIQSIEKFILNELLEGELTNLDPNANLDSLGIESLDILELVFFIEKQFSIKLPKEALKSDNIKSLNSIANYTSQLLDV